MASDATAYSRDEKAEFWVLGGKLGEALYCSLHALKTFHRGNGVTLSLKAFTLTPDGTEVVHGLGCSTTCMETTDITTEDEYLVGLKRDNTVGGHSRAMVFASKLAFVSQYLLVSQARLGCGHHVELMVECVARGVLIAPTAPCADDIVAELHIIIYREQIGHALDIMGGTHVRE